MAGLVIFRLTKFVWNDKNRDNKKALRKEGLNRVASDQKLIRAFLVPQQLQDLVITRHKKA